MASRDDQPPLTAQPGAIRLVVDFRTGKVVGAEPAGVPDAAPAQDAGADGGPASAEAA